MKRCSIMAFLIIVLVATRVLSHAQSGDELRFYLRSDPKTLNVITRLHKASVSSLTPLA